MSEIFSKILKDKNGKKLNVGSKYTQPEWGVEENGVILPESTFTGEEELSITQPFALVAGREYVVNWNGTPYKCKAEEIQGDTTMVAVGNIGAATGGESTDEPFIIMCIPSELVEDMGMYGAAMAFDGSTSVTLSIIGSVFHVIPSEHLENAFTLRVHVSTNKRANKTFAEIMDCINGGGNVYITYDLGLDAGMLVLYPDIIIPNENGYITFARVSDTRNLTIDSNNEISTSGF